MVEAPEKIWAYETPDGDTGWLCDPTHGQATGSTEFVRSDIAERQIAELRAEVERLDSELNISQMHETIGIERFQAAEAENARLRALPLKDEVERVLEEVRDNGLIYWEPNTARGQDRKTAVVERLDALLSHLRAGEQEATAWRPMDSAPKDGTQFIALEDGDIYKCNWLEQDDGEGHFSEGWWDHVNQSFENPTHWTPLPASPSEQGGDRS